MVGVLAAVGARRAEPQSKDRPPSLTQDRRAQVVLRESFSTHGGGLFRGHHSAPRCRRPRLGIMKTKDRPPTFWSMPVSIFGMFEFTRFITGSRVFALLPSLAPEPRDARRFTLASRVLLLPLGRGTLSGWLRTKPLPALLASLSYYRRNGRSCHRLIKSPP